MSGDDDIFTDENLVDTEEETSPSGRYRLITRRYCRPSTPWQYTRQTAVRVADRATIMDVRATSHHALIDKDGRDFVILSRPQARQLVFNLDGGAEYQAQDDGRGDGFIWETCLASPGGRTLLVDGGLAFGPHELRFYDFTDPAKGWPELRPNGVECLASPSGNQPPRWLDARRAECHLLDERGEPQERVRLLRSGREMAVIERWLSPAELARWGAAVRAAA